MGKEAMKQYLAAAALLQQMQHCILYGDAIVPSITQGGMVKWSYLGIKHSENAKRMARFEDTAASKPLTSYPERDLHPSSRSSRGTHAYNVNDNRPASAFFSFFCA